MTLRLWIENVDRLPDGGPLRVEVKGRGLDLGRDAHLDWTLPDPTRNISSKHCEIRFRDGGYWLHDVSTNGTFVNGAQYRLDAPYLLREGDRLSIGPYIIAVSVEGQATPIPEGGAVQPLPRAIEEDVWGEAGEAAPPDDRSAYLGARAAEQPPDFLDFLAPPAPTKEDSPWPHVSKDDDWPAAPQSVQPAPPPRRPEPMRFAVEESPAAPAPQGPPPASRENVDILRRIAAAAGIPEQAIVGRDPESLAEDIGRAIRLTVENLAQMLSSRAESKTLMRSASRTVVRSMENNPLKFTSSTEEALAIMFGPPKRQYLDLKSTIEFSFHDLKTHQVLTYGAIQGALDALFQDLAPDQIDRSVSADRGLGSLVVPRKAKLWDTYIERWRAKTKRSDGRLFEAFIALFAEAYDRLERKG
jgi:type VI secretion system protein ImpI